MNRLRIVLVSLSIVVLIACIYSSTRPFPFHAPTAGYVPVGMENDGFVPYGWTTICHRFGCERCGSTSYMNRDTPGLSTMVLISYCSIPAELKGLTSEEAALKIKTRTYVDSSYVNGTMTVGGETAYYNRRDNNESEAMTLQGINGNVYYYIICGWNTSGNEESKVMSLIESLDF